MDARALTLEERRPLSLSFLHKGAAITALAGGAVSLSLVISHVRVFTDPTYESFCAISRSLNCETVSQSPWALLAGVPVAVWANLGYLAFLGLLSIRRDRHAVRPALSGLALAVSIGFVAYSLFLAGISSLVIGSYCLLCMALYAVNFALLGWSWAIFRRTERPAFFQALALDLQTMLRTRAGKGFLALTFAVAVAFKLFYPAYWEIRPAGPAGDLANGLTAEGHPWIGATEPVLEIVEFADYLCFQCRKMHVHLRRLVERYPQKIRLVHVHYPMDHEVNPAVKTPFHIGAGKLAMVAIHAAKEGKFWEVNDLLFALAESRSEVDLREIASRTGLSVDGLAGALADTAVARKLAADLSYAASVGVEATPTFLVGGKKYLGTIPEEVFRGVLQ